MHTDYERYRKMASLAQVGWWEADLREDIIFVRTFYVNSSIWREILFLFKISKS